MTKRKVYVLILLNVNLLLAQQSQNEIFLTTEETQGPENLTCGCTTETLPHPRIILLGPTGVGKSTFGNRLLGITEDNGKEGICSENGEKVFGVGHRTESHTVETSWIVGHYLGDPKNPCITIIDTPGTGDTEGRDCEHGIALAKGIKEIGSVDAFIIMFKGTNPRFSQPMQDQIHLYINIFGEEMFRNSITEFSYWSHDKRSVRKRAKTRDGLNEEIQHQIWNHEYASRMPIPIEIPTVFIDPVYDEEFAEPRETEKYEEYTGKLWELLTKHFKPFNCAKRCKAPSGFFNGQPWLFDENSIINKRPEDRLTITWQIWFAGCDGTGTKSYKIFFKSHKSHVESTPQVVYEHIVEDDDKESIRDHNLLKGMRVTDELFDKFKTIKINVKSIMEEHFGFYYLENDKGMSNTSAVNKIVDGKWAEWSAYGECSKHCIKGNEQPGEMVRQRECIPPQNGGIECRGTKNQTKSCAHRNGDSPEYFRQCPEDAHWSSWVNWGRCSANCIKEDYPLPTKSRSRICFQERYQGKSCGELQNEERQKGKVLSEEEKECSELPSCPSAASLGPWSEWSSCNQTCVKEGAANPQSSRKRGCKKETLSTDKSLNSDVLTCEALGDEMAYKPCSIPTCQVEPSWTSWEPWSDCSKTCTKGQDVGRRQRHRSFTPGRFGAPIQPKGKQHESENCKQEVSCPVAATWQWGEWSSCDQTCYYKDGSRGLRMRENQCTEGDPVHDVLNCKYPPGGLTDIQQGCPGLPECVIPVRTEYIEKKGSCFGFETLVTTSSGNQKLMRDLRIGDEVLSDKGMTKFIGWMEYSSQVEIEFLEIITETGSITLTGSHNVFYYKDGKATPTYAENLRPGNIIVAGSGEGRVIMSMMYVNQTGSLDPLTQSGTIVSNDIVTSCYASFPHHLADLALWPAKLFPRLLLDNEDTQHREGTRAYITFIKWVGRDFWISKTGKEIEGKNLMSTIVIVSILFLLFSRSRKY